MSFFRTSNIYLVLALIVFAGSGVYGFLQYNVVRAQQQAVTDNENIREQIGDELASAQDEFKRFAEQRAKKQQEFAKKIIGILPSNENYTELTRQFDNYFASHDRPGNALFLSSLRFGKGTVYEANGALSVLPISMNIEGTRDNFFKFLDFVKNSGSVESGTRLLELKSIQLNFPEDGEDLKDPKQKLNFTLELNAYYQTPKVAR